MLKRISRSIIVSLLSVSMVLTSVTPVFADDLISEDDILSVQEEAVEGYDFDDDVVEEDISDVQSDSVTEISEEGDLIVDTSEEFLINDDTEILTTEEVWDGITTEKVYEQDDIKYVFRITSSWSGGYNAKVEIYNNRSEIIDNWDIDMVFSGEITNIWNATIENRDDRTYTIKNAAWNADIKSGHSVSFGFTGKGEFGGFPESFNTLGLIVEKSDEEYDVQYYLDSDWGSGFTGRIVITNNSDETIEDWILSFTFDREITSIWNASIESHEGNRYVVKNKSYNANILPGKSVAFGFNGKQGSVEDIPESSVLNSHDLKDLFVEINVNDEELTYNESADWFVVDGLLNTLEGSVTNPENVKAIDYIVKDFNENTVISGNITPGKSWSINNFGLALGYNKLEFSITT